MSDKTEKSNRDEIKDTEKKSVRDAISMIICDEAGLVVNEELYLNCDKSYDVADRILHIEENRTIVDDIISSKPAWKDVGLADKLIEPGQVVWAHDSKAVFEVRKQRLIMYDPHDKIWHDGTITHFAEKPQAPEI